MMGVSYRFARIYQGNPIMPQSSTLMPQAHAPIGAGSGVEPVEGYDAIDINEMITGGAEHFRMYTVTGDSMVPDIRPGSRVIVNPDAIPQTGDRVVTDLGGLYSVKYFAQSHRGLHLVSSNGDYPDREVTPEDDFRVVGVVKAAIALYR